MNSVVKHVPAMLKAPGSFPSSTQKLMQVVWPLDPSDFLTSALENFKCRETTKTE